MKDDDLYARYQTLTALVSVLLHDLRNPLHSSTLLVEAMGSRMADIDSLRGKLRGQFGKLEALMSEASDSIKELGLEARIEEIAVDELLRSAAASSSAVAGTDFELELPSSSSGFRVAADKTLLALAIAEIGASVSERAAKAGSDKARKADGTLAIPLTIDQPDAGNVRIVVGSWVPVTDDAAVKAPFAIAGGGMRLALARTLTQMAGAGLRLEQSPEGSLRYAIHLPRRS
jgi:signal transduction histidine kinase